MFYNVTWEIGYCRDMARRVRDCGTICKKDVLQLSHLQNLPQISQYGWQQQQIFAHHDNRLSHFTGRLAEIASRRRRRCKGLIFFCERWICCRGQSVNSGIKSPIPFSPFLPISSSHGENCFISLENFYQPSQRSFFVFLCVLCACAQPPYGTVVNIFSLYSLL